MIKTDPCHAWCVELNRIVHIREVWELFFGDKKLNSPLTFQCPVEGCRIKLIVQGLSPVPIYPMQFRRYPGGKHIHPPKIRKPKDSSVSYIRTSSSIGSLRGGLAQKVE